MTAFRRTIATPDTFGFASSSARRTKARAEGRVSAEQGRHRGGPCPAVALATLTGWTYARAERYLERYGFRGAGMMRDTILRAFRDLLGPELHLERPGCRVADAGHRFLGRDGIVFCSGHVMPVRAGRVLNAGADHRRMQCELLLVWSITEERA